jgi:hypothetical protein
MQHQDSGLWRRGLLLLALMAALAVVVLVLVLHRAGGPEVPPEGIRPEPLVPLVSAPAAGFPGGVSWGALYELGEALPSPPGWETRYNATVALARRGSPVVRLDVLREMLDEQRQMRNFRSPLADGRTVPDEAAARRTVLNALKAVRDWHHHAEAVKAVGPDSPQVKALYAAVDRLADSPNAALSSAAQELRLALQSH